MKRRSIQPGMTIMEMTVVILTAAVLAGFAVPAIKGLVNSYEFRGGNLTMIEATLASARAMAAREHCYLGVRFQQDLQGSQWMVFIRHDPAATGLANGFCAVEGVRPAKLPESTGVMAPVNVDDQIDTPAEVSDMTTISIVFGPSGKLVVHDVWVRNMYGYTDKDSQTRIDKVFNTAAKVNAGQALLLQDDYQNAQFNLKQEPSRRNFVIYDRTAFSHVPEDKRYSNYLGNLDAVRINPYTGMIIQVDTRR